MQGKENILKDLDYLKVIGILLVVIGHCTSIYTGGWVYKSPVNAPIYGLIASYVYTFHVPMLVFVSGAIYYYCRKNKEKYKSLGFAKYAEQHRKLPITDKVKKGNATEILLTDYIQASQKKEFIKVYKLKYNPNVDQAIKGDDTLMVDLFEENGNEKIKIYLGESKFRTTPQKNVVEDITKSLNKDTLPLSYTFLVEEIAKSDELLARKLDDYIVQDIKDRGDLIYVGLLLSNTKTSETVEKHLNSDNSNLVFISIGIGQPEEFIKSIFEKAEELISNPDLL